MKLNRIPALVLALTMLFALASCGGKEAEETSSVHDFVYVDTDGAKYSGTYTGDWENDCPNGEGSFTGEGERGQITMVGSWSDGQPNGQYRYTLTTDTFVETYSGNVFFGEIRGTGNYKMEDLAGNLLLTYSGEVRDNNFNGAGELTYYYTQKYAAEYGFSREIQKGQFSSGVLNGEGEATVYYTAEYITATGCDYTVCKGQYSNGNLNGNAEVIYHYTEEYAAANGIDNRVLSGEYQNGDLLGSQRYTLYKDGKVIEKGTYKDEKYISDGEKALKDGIYDGLRDFAGDGIWGTLFDAFGPAFYDRYGD